MTSGPKHKGRHQGGDEQTGKDAQRPLGEKMQRVGGLLEALRHEKAADRKEHEDAGETEDRLVAGQKDQRLVVLRALARSERNAKR